MFVVLFFWLRLSLNGKTPFFTTKKNKDTHTATYSANKQKRILEICSGRNDWVWMGWDGMIRGDELYDNRDGVFLLDVDVI